MASVRKRLKKSSESWKKFANVSLWIMMPVVCGKKGGKWKNVKIQVKERTLTSRSIMLVRMHVCAYAYDPETRPKYT